MIIINIIYFIVIYINFIGTQSTQRTSNESGYSTG